MNGKSKCRILKDIRRQIAQDNDIEFVTSECKYQGDCTGTCPKCEAEVRYLEQELAKRQAAGKAIAVAGIAAALAIGSAGCAMDISSTAGDIEPPASTRQTDPTQTDPTYPNTDLAGDIVIPTDPTAPTDPPTAGVPLPDDFTEQPVLGGDPMPEYTYMGMMIAP